MMHQTPFGDLLRDARQREGMSIEDISRALHVRADIIEVIESSDVSAMPPEAYSKKMIANYADLVGLEPSRVAQLYADQSYSSNVANARSSRARAQQIYEEAIGGIPMRSGVRRESRYDTTAQGGAQAGASRGRTRFGDVDEGPLRMPTSRNNVYAGGPGYTAAAQGRASAASPETQYGGSRGRVREEFPYEVYGTPRGVGAQRAAAANSANSAFEDTSAYGARGSRGERSSTRQMVSADLSHDAGYRDSASSGRSSSSSRRSVSGGSSRRSRTHASRGTALPDAHTANLYSAANFAGSSRASRPSFVPFIIIGIIVVLIIVLVLTLVVGGKAKKNAETPSAPITGLTDPEAGGEGSADAIIVPVAPSSVEFAYSIASGSENYVEIYLDDNENAEVGAVLEGPDKRSFDVTGKLRFVCTNPDGITVTVDGKPVELELQEDSDWIYTYELDFTEFLANWQKEHADEIAAAEKAKAELIAAQEAEKKASESPAASASAGASSSPAATTSSSTGKTTASQ